MQSPTISVRPLETVDEVTEFFHVCIYAFWPDANQEKTIEWWLRSHLELPRFSPRQVRAAFIDDTMVGGCVVHDRRLRMPPVELRTDCIGLVATHPDYRGRGVARAVLEDTIARATAQDHDLLLLGGVPNLYHLFGFIDVFDGVEHRIDRAAVLALPPSACQVRAATLDDAPLLLALYERHFGPSTGSFARDLEDQVHRLRFRGADDPPLLVFEPNGEPLGYLLPNSGRKPSRADEVAVESWPAALALLQHQARLLEGPLSPPTEITWVAPPASPTLFHVLDNLTFPRVTPVPPYPNWYVVHSQTRHLPLAGSMARPANLAALVTHLLPRWQERKDRYVGRWPGALALEIGDARFVLDDQAGQLRLMEQARGTTLAVRLSSTAFTQLLFGFRPASWLASQPSSHVDEAALPVLESLFPTGHTWFAASDAF